MNNNRGSWASLGGQQTAEPSTVTWAVERFAEALCDGETPPKVLKGFLDSPLVIELA